MASGPLALIYLIALFSIILNAANLKVGARPLTNELDFTGATTTTTTTATTDANGNPVIQTCTITFTPSGTDNVVMVETCVDTPDTSGGGSGSTQTTPTTDTATTATATASSSVQTSSVVATDSVSTGTGTATISITATATSTGSIVATATNGGVIDLGTSAIPTNSFPAAATPSTTGSVTTTATATTTGSVKPSGTDVSVTTSSGDTVPTVAAAINTSLPGKSISVLPIGLGVFAGLSVIAMVVVGAVTYERTKYRKAFRAKKLAEAGGAMGYGGMAAAARV